jgi:sirohydrochlorin ferrochelatase
MNRLLGSVVAASLLAAPVFAQTASASAENPSHTGILLMAHGGRLQTWNEEVRHVADHVDLEVPTEVAFGMATRSTLQAGVDRLAARGVTEIIAVPLFVSSHSSVIDSTAYLLGVSTTAPEDLKMFASMDHDSMNHGGGMDMSHMADNPEAMKPVASKVPIRMASALDHHAIVAEILTDRAATISKKPADEVVILIAHGPVPDEENKLWLADMKLLADSIKAKTGYAEIQYMTLRDDADDPVRDAATTELRQRIEKVNAKKQTALIVPLLLSFGGIENGLVTRLKGLEYRMPTQGLLPDQRIPSWVLASEKAIATSAGAAQASR